MKHRPTTGPAGAYYVYSAELAGLYAEGPSGDAQVKSGANMTARRLGDRSARVAIPREIVLSRRSTRAR